MGVARRIERRYACSSLAASAARAISPSNEDKEEEAASPSCEEEEAAAADKPCSPTRLRYRNSFEASERGTAGT